MPKKKTKPKPIQSQVISCDECGIIIEDGSHKEIDGLFLCEDCFSQLYIQCIECNETVLKEDAVNYEGNNYCEDCFNDTFSYCQDCNTVIEIGGDSCFEYEDALFCERCFRNRFFECEGCNEVFPTNDAFIGANDLPYCDNCYYEEFISCSNCGETMYRDDAYYSDNEDAYFCSGCYEERSGYCDYINRYNYRPSDAPFYKLETEKKEKEFFGIEIEMENKENIDVEELNEILGNIVNESPSMVYFKEDGSLNNGFEMVSYPATFSYLKSKKESIDRWLKQFSNNGFRSYNTKTCGLHIHVSKDSITHLQLYKLLKLFYENPSFIMKVSKRSEGNFNQWASLRENSEDGNMVMKAKTKHGYDRYVAINLSNTHTIEFRIFRGTLKTDSVFKNLEFIKSCLDFCKDNSIKEISKDNYFRYVKNHRIDYKNLYGYLLQNFLLPT